MHYSVIRRSCTGFAHFSSKYKLSPFQRAFVVPYFAAQSILDPTRGDMVAGLGDALACSHTLKTLKSRMEQSLSGQELLRTKPLITSASLNMPRLRQLSSDTLGRAYAEYVDSHHFSADERDHVRFINDSDLAYIVARYRQVHDFWHVLCDLPPTETGELALKWFEFRHTGLPIGAVSAVCGPLRLSPREIRQLVTLFYPWAERAAKNSVFLLSVKYEDLLESPLKDVRAQLRIEKAPKMT